MFEIKFRIINKYLIVKNLQTLKTTIMKPTIQKLKMDNFNVLNKTNSLQTITWLFAMVVVFFTLSAFKATPKVVNDQVMIYGIVYLEECGSETALSHVAKLVPSDNYYKEQQNLEALLQSSYPNAKKIQMSSSKFQYGNNASNMCVMQWYIRDMSCTYNVIKISFGQTAAEALENAIKDKNTWAGSNAEYTIKKQKYW